MKKSIKTKLLIASLLSSNLVALPLYPVNAEEMDNTEMTEETDEMNESDSSDTTMEETKEENMEGGMEETTEPSVTTKEEHVEEKDPIPTDKEELKKLIKDYGTKITVKDLQMNVYELGAEHKGESKTLVFMPGLGEASQPLTHKNLLDALAKKYHILVVEPFGYGLSDVSNEERTVENITEELHSALEQMDVKEYYLVAHSLSGLYALKYSQMYQDEVLGVIGMDTSTPMMNGFMEMQHEEAPIDDSGQATDLPEIPDVDDEVNLQYQYIAQLNLNNADVVDESARSNQVLNDFKDEKIPSGIPALYLLAQDSYEDIEMRREFMDKITEDWEMQHKLLSENPDEVETHILEGDHLIYMTQYEEMARLIDEFINNHN
ncbi:alpha/beta fold hydrolase [Dolosicoccus paucivorans]|uniref:Alpha/beta hydrolase n=1 Tax=Dolosicoccus paucivorans TaxID=84521 RepID=A0A2N6SLB3_9LACT|nr:alpha/beta hydrolase family protein [Dolosicoccus paucivorans]PMB85175.1 alpha/beta hydrolase [Dolosicoccus paucivorans]PMC57853.1 alpha/beta hydrolase [Dolosicoccus paucivorans]